MNSALKLIVGIWLGLIAIGCSRQEPNDDHIISGIEDLKKNDAMVVVNGFDYTAKMYEDGVDLRKALVLHRQSKLKPEAIKALDAKIKSTYLVGVIERLLLSQKIKSSGMTAADPVIVAGVQAKYARTFGIQRESFARLRSALTAEQAKMLDDQIEEEALTMSYMRQTYSNELYVTEAEIDKTLARVKLENDQADMTNRFLYAHATNLCIRARKGENFAKLADRFSQDEGRNPGGSIGECDASDFKNEADGSIWVKVEALKEGEVSDPMITSEGITIFKCDKVIAKSENTEKPARELSRICIHRALKYPEYTRKDVRAELSVQHRDAVLKKLAAWAHKDAKVSLPFGLAVLPQSTHRYFSQYLRFVDPNTGKLTTTNFTALAQATNNANAVQYGPTQRRADRMDKIERQFNPFHKPAKKEKNKK